MMDLWFQIPPALPSDGVHGLCRVGAVGHGLKPVHQPADIDGEADAWLLPAGLAVNLPLIEAAAATGRPLLVTINGLGDKALAAVRACAGPAMVLTFDARGLEPVPLLEQLAWLSRQPEPFALVVEGDSAAMLAAMAGARALVVLDDDAVLDAALVLRILSAARAGAPRPLSPGEVDGVDDRQTCLTVRRAYVPGETIAADDLVLAVTETRGLSPMLAKRVAGLRLLYPVMPGEPLHFGHFKDPAP